MPDRVDPLLNPVQLPDLCPLPSQFLIEVRELPKSDESVLTRGEITEPLVEIRPTSPLTGRFPDI
jgi:hypothetical protein